MSSFPGASKEMSDLLERAVNDYDGVKVTRTDNGHYKVTRDGYTGMVTLPATPSDHRSVKNSRAQLRRTLGLFTAGDTAPVTGLPRISRRQVLSALMTFGEGGATARQVAEAVYPDDIAENLRTVGSAGGYAEVHAMRGLLRTAVNKGQAKRIGKQRRDGHKASEVYVYVPLSQKPVQEAPEPVSETPKVQTPVSTTREPTVREKAVQDMKDAVDFLLSQPMESLEFATVREQVLRLEPYVRLCSNWSGQNPAGIVLPTFNKENS